MAPAKDDPTHLIHRLLRTLEARDALSPQEVEALASMVDGQETHPAGADVVVEGRRERVSRLLFEGMAARVKLLDDGRKQITALHLPGDFVDLHSFPLKRLDHDVVSLTPVRFILFPHDRIRVVTEAIPHLGRLFWTLTMVDAATHRAWIVSSGRLTALEQVGSLFCELFTRSSVAGLVQGDSCPLPITQQLLADACGLSSVHVNRVLQELREIRLITWRGGMLSIHDFEALAGLSKFDSSYLSLNREPR
jgi:CRP-like cAMP-binding protein